MAEFRCKAMQMSDQKVCRACNLVWDMNDPEPPECKGAAAESLAEVLRDDFKPAKPTKWKYGHG